MFVRLPSMETESNHRLFLTQLQYLTTTAKTVACRMSLRKSVHLLKQLVTYTQFYIISKKYYFC